MPVYWSCSSATLVLYWHCSGSAPAAAQGVEYATHMELLAARSSTFAALIPPAMRAAGSGRVELENVRMNPQP